MKIKILAFLIMIVFTLAACGQSDSAIEPSSKEADGIDSEHNEEVIDKETNETITNNDEKQISSNTANEQNKTILLYFSDKDVTNLYAVETQVSGDDNELLVNALKAWINGPEQENLISLIPSNVEVQSVEEIDGIAHISFSKEILDAQLGSGAEQMVIQQIGLILKQEPFAYDQIQILVDGEKIESLAGHVTIDQPVQVEPDLYEIKKLEE